MLKLLKSLSLATPLHSVCPWMEEPYIIYTHTHMHNMQYLVHLLIPSIFLQRAVQEAVIKAKQHYEAVVQDMNTELAAKYETQRTKMASEIRVLEDKLATLLQQKYNADQAKEGTDVDQSAAASLNEGTSQESGLYQSSIDMSQESVDSRCVRRKVGVACEKTGSDALEGLLKNTAGELRKEILLLVSKKTNLCDFNAYIMNSACLLSCIS